MCHSFDNLHDLEELIRAEFYGILKGRTILVKDFIYLLDNMLAEMAFWIRQFYGN
jgi:hypothetical protein